MKRWHRLQQNYSWHEMYLCAHTASKTINKSLEVSSCRAELSNQKNNLQYVERQRALQLSSSSPYYHKIRTLVHAKQGYTWNRINIQQIVNNGFLTGNLPFHILFWRFSFYNTITISLQHGFTYERWHCFCRIQHSVFYYEATQTQMSYDEKYSRRSCTKIDKNSHGAQIM